MTNKEFEKFFAKFGNKFGEFEDNFEKIGNEFEKFEIKFEKWELEGAEGVEGLEENFDFKNDLNHHIDIDFVCNNKISVANSSQLANISSGIAIPFYAIVAAISLFYILSNFYIFVLFIFGYLFSGFVVFRKELFPKLKTK